MVWIIGLTILLCLHVWIPLFTAGAGKRGDMFISALVQSMMPVSLITGFAWGYARGFDLVRSTFIALLSFLLFGFTLSAMLPAR